MTPVADVPPKSVALAGSLAIRLRLGLARRLYGLAWRLARPILRRRKRLADGFAWRLVPRNWSRGTGEQGRVDVWIQAASGGEAYLAWEILERLADGTPLSALVTTWTRQGLEVLHGMAEKLRRAHPELAVRVTLFPLDQPSIMARALDQARPRAIALLETELWPGLLLAAADRRIPVFVLNGRMTEKSLRNYLRLERLCPGFWPSVAPRRTSAVSEADAGRFTALFGPERVTTAPNIKFDRCLPDRSPHDGAGASPVRPDSRETGALPLLERAARPLILLASVREEEEEPVMAVIRRLAVGTRDEKGGPTLVIAPRHMHRVSAWKERLAGMGGIILWDRFGELAALYAAADAVFVGGSLAPLGGQNFLEALAAGRVPCCGPHLDNFAWALAPGGPADDTLEKRGLLLPRRTPEEVAETLLDLARRPFPPEEIRRRFLDWLTPRLGGSARCAALLREAIRAQSNHSAHTAHTKGGVPCET